MVIFVDRAAALGGVTDVDLNGGGSILDVTGTIYTPQLTRKHEDNRVRAQPEMQKRIKEAAGQFDIRYRVDKPYRLVTVTWIALEGYSRDNGKFESERVLGRSSIANRLG